MSGHVATVAEMILRSWARSSNSQLARGFIEIAYGKVPDELRIDLSRLNDAELIKYVGPILARLGISLEPPIGARMESSASNGELAQVDAASDTDTTSG